MLYYPFIHGDIILPPLIRLSYYYHSTSYTSTCTTLNPHITYTCAKLNSKTIFQKMMYLHTFDYTCILRFVPHFLNFKFIHSLSLSRLTSRVQAVYFTAHVIICTNSLTCFLTLGSNQISTSTLTHVL